MTLKVTGTTIYVKFIEKFFLKKVKKKKKKKKKKEINNNKFNWEREQADNLLEAISFHSRLIQS